MFELILSSLIIGAGLFLGLALGFIAKEELKPGKKYFLFLKNVLIAAPILIIAVYYFFVNFWISLAVLLSFGVFIHKKFQVVLTYFMFSVLLVLSLIDDSLFIVVSSIIFFAGFPIGSLLCESFPKKNKLKFVLIEFVIPYLLFVGFSIIGFIILS